MIAPIVTAPAHGEPGHVCTALCPYWLRPEDGSWQTRPLIDSGYNRQARMAAFPYLAALAERTLLFDGATGTELHRVPLTAADYGAPQHEGCPEILCLTRPEVIDGVHERYLNAGADVIETNSFGALPAVLAEYDLADRAEDLAQAAAALARAAADRHATPDRPRFVAGTMGPGTRLMSLGQIGWEEAFAGYLLAARGLIRGGADLLLVETAQDILQVRCAVLACREAMRQLDRELPIQAQVTIERSGTMLAGSDLDAAAAALDQMPVDVVGLNCATGPDLMLPQLRRLRTLTSRFLSCLPNAGLPRNVDGQAVFDLGPEDFAQAVAEIIAELGLEVCGGCCGTGPLHIAALRRALDDLPARPHAQTGAPARISSLFQAVDLRQENGPLFIGERCNATGSKAFRSLLLDQDLDGISALAQDQVAAGAQALDVSVSWTGRDAQADFRAVLGTLRERLSVPLMIDSTDPEDIRVALEQTPGCPLINSVNFEAGEERFDRICSLARLHGAALVALVIDEDRDQGMAKTAARKLAIAERIYQRAVHRHGIDPRRLLFDLLTFPVTQGDEDSRGLALATLEAMQTLHQRHPEVGFVLGLSNVSFGIKPAARRILNAVFLDEARRHGLSAAILDPGRIVPLAQIPEEVLITARDLIHDRRRPAADGDEGYDPLLRFIALAAGGLPQPETASAADAPLDQRLGQALIAGAKTAMSALLDEALAAGRAAADLINGCLLPAMQEVGQRFGDGRMPLPFVLQSAATMQTAVDHLQPHLGAAGQRHRGTMVLATVRGDVHDIGKNLVRIILANNGFQVIDLGIKQDVTAIHEAAESHAADAIGMSGLLVASTQIMRDNLHYLSAQGCHRPVICGGAALNEDFVTTTLSAAYPDGQVFYARDAFAGLHLMDAICQGQAPAPSAARPARRPAPTPAPLPPPSGPVSLPPHWQRQCWQPQDLDLQAIRQALDEQALIRGRWDLGQDQDFARQALDQWLAHAATHQLWQPAAVARWLPAAAQADHLVLFDPESGHICGRIHLPPYAGLPSCAGHVRPLGQGDDPAPAGFPAAAWAAGARDCVALQAVTIGAAATDHARRLHDAGDYRDYLLLHGLAAQMAEALAAHIHALLAQAWRNSLPSRRLSCGYPAWPSLEDQTLLQEILHWQDIGLGLSPSCQLIPEASTSALVLATATPQDDPA